MPRLSLVALFLLACVSQKTQPQGALEAYRSALKNKNYDAAYSMMSEGFRASYSKAQFLAAMEQRDKGTGDTARELARGYRKVEARAEVVYGAGETMRLLLEDGEWRVDSSPLEFYGQSTPRECLRSFLRAYRLGRWDKMLQFVPQNYREKMSEKTLREQFKGNLHEEMTQLMRRLEINVNAPIVEKGAQAKMLYGDNQEVEFVLEDGRWKIGDLD